jgi:hypothetical protein
MPEVFLDIKIFKLAFPFPQKDHFRERMIYGEF